MSLLWKSFSLNTPFHGLPDWHSSNHWRNLKQSWKKQWACMDLQLPPWPNFSLASRLSSSSSYQQYPFVPQQPCHSLTYPHPFSGIRLVYTFPPCIKPYFKQRPLHLWTNCAVQAHRQQTTRCPSLNAQWGPLDENLPPPLHQLILAIGNKPALNILSDSDNISFKWQQK